MNDLSFLKPVYPVAVALALSLWANLSFFISRNEWDQEYDYIVVGGGTAGCVVANRLSEDPTVTVLLIEAGGFENVYSKIPLSAPTLQRTSMDWAFKTSKQKHACKGYENGQCIWTQGKSLGGSSSLNYMLYVRGNKNDYDLWEEMGATGWSFSNVLPYFLKSEDNLDNDVFRNGYHGSGGYLTVSRAKFITPLGSAFVDAGQYLGYSHLDFNGPIQTGFNVPQGTVRDGSRLSSSAAFIEPIKDRKNLHILVKSFVTKVLFNDEKRAFGVTFNRKNSINKVLARKEIILSAGTVGSPKILLLSGVGPKNHLDSLMIPVAADLPVGRNLQDHICAGSVTFTINATFSYTLDKVLKVKSFSEYIFKRQGLLTSLVGVEGIGFIKTKYAEKNIDWPDVQIFMISGSVASDDGYVYRHGQGLNEEMWEKVFKPYIGRDMFTLYPSVLRPKSRGYVELRSTDYNDPPIVNPRYYSSQKDLLTMVEAMKFAVKLGLAPSFKKFGSEIIETRIPGCEEYPYLSDKYHACAAQVYSQSIYHLAGTCRMGSADDGRSVVDPQLRVLGGIKGLRVADTSIMPNVISGNTNAAAVMIGERVSDMIKGIEPEPMIIN